MPLLDRAYGFKRCYEKVWRREGKHPIFRRKWVCRPLKSAFEILVFIKLIDQLINSSVKGFFVCLEFLESRSLCVHINIF